MTETQRPCPFCAEAIAPEAVRCPHCRSRLAVLDPAAWHRDHAERKLAGVAASVSRALAVPVAFVRAGFVLLTFVHFAGILAYAALWAVIPRRPGEPSPFDRLAARARAEIARLLRGGPRSGGGRTDAGGHPATAVTVTTDAAPRSPLATVAPPDSRPGEPPLAPAADQTRPAA